MIHDTNQTMCRHKLSTVLHTSESTLMVLIDTDEVGPRH